MTWHLAWDTARLQRSGASWQWRTDQGYDITLRQGLLTTWRLGLEPCPPQVAWSLIPAAWAHHIEPPDPTSVMPHLREDLLQLATTTLPAKALPPNRYCRGLWLASAPPPAQADGQPRLTLQLLGTWRRGAAQGELSVETWLPDARFQSEAGLAAAPTSATVVLTRHLADALDGIDLATAQTEALAWHVLHRLTSRADVQVQPR